MIKDLRENRTPGAILLNILIAFVSLFVNGFGVYLTIQANIGAGPWDVLNIGLSKTFGILYGSASITVSITILIVDILLKEPIGIAMFIDAITVGKAVDFFNWLNVVPPCRTVPVRQRMKWMAFPSASSSSVRAVRVSASAWASQSWA